MNRFISIISAVSLWVICYCVLAGGNASAQTTIGFSIANATITEKDTFSILFKADSSFTGKKVYAFRFGLSYNASYLECLGVSPAGTILSAWGAPTVNTQTAGKITVAGAGSSPLSGSGDMFRIKFRATRGGGTYVENIATLSYLNEGSPSLSVKSSYIQCNSRSYPDIYPDNYTLYVGDELQMNVSGGTAPYVYKVVDTAVALISAGSKVRAKGPGTTQVFVTDSKGEISYTTGVIDVRAIKLRVVHSTAWPGENFLVPVRIEIAPGTKVFAGSFELGFSGNIQGISSSAQQGDFQVSVQNKAYPNVMKVSFASSSGITASGILCYLGFKAVNSGMQYVNINSALFNESLLAITYNENAEIYSLPTLTITPNGANMMWGSTQKITVGNGTPPLTYQTSDTTIATIDALGNLYGKTGGKVKVKVTDSHGATQTSNDFLFYHNQFAVTNTDGVLDKDTRVPITTTLLPPGKAVFAFTGTITYNTTYLEFVRIDPVNAGMIVEGVNNNGSVNVVGASGSGITNGIVCYMIFRIKNTLALNQQADVTLGSFVANENEYFSTLASGKVKRVAQVSYRPVAVAGPNQRVNEGVLVTLDGSGSYDDDNNPLKYSWKAPPGIKLNDSTLVKPTFTAPQVNVNTNLTFTLVVNDGTSNSDPSTVVITVLQINKPPVANAGPDRSYAEGSTVSLDGSLSYDLDGEALSFNWTSLDGVVLFDSKSVSPSFIAPQVSVDTKYRFRLVVYDGVAFSAADTVAVTALQVNKKPVAFAGGDQTVNEGVKVTLDGSLSSDPDGNPVTYLWTAPANVTLSSRTVAKPTFTAPPVHRDSTISISLVVNDGTLNSDADNVVITIKNVDILSQEAKIKTASLAGADSVRINTVTSVVTLYMPYGSDLKALAPTFTISDKATLNPKSGTVHDFTSQVAYTVTAEDGLTTTTYQVKVFVPNLTLSRTLSAGWNWISMSVEPANAALNSVFTGLTFANLDYVKSATSSAVYYSGTGWFGDLAALPANEMVKIKKAVSQKMSLTGTQINPSQVTIPVAPGWNRIAYLLKGNSPLNSAFDKATLPAGDLLIKSKEASAIYYPATGWIGDLDSMKVLNGYMLKASSTGSLRYNAAGVKHKSAVTNPAMFLRDDLYAMYNIHPENFEYSAIFISELAGSTGESTTRKGDLLIAYMSGEPRGVTEALYIPDLGRYIFVITVFSNTKDDISFQVKSTESNVPAPLAEKFIFTSDEVYGTPSVPLQLHAIPTGIGKDVKVEVNIYPNPVSDKLHVVSGSAISRVTVYNSTGNSMLVLSNIREKELEMNTAGLSPGLFTIKIETSSGVQVQKFIKSPR